MNLPSGTAQAEQIKLRKTCRGCKQPLYGSCQDEEFAVAGIGIMHLECARQYCSQQGMELEDAVPICKHWHLKGHCIYQVGHVRVQTAACMFSDGFGNASRRQQRWPCQKLESGCVLTAGYL